ncbi:MAG: CCA tRNA nucleotidyltransferase [Polyangiaceae bacterium]
MSDSVLALLPKEVIGLCDRLREKGKRGWIVGGCVRDLLAGRAVSDWDIATDALPQEVQKIFPKVIPTGIAHGTVTVLQHGKAYEVTTLRGETTYSDGRHPDAVHFVDDITADLARRDFTFNAIAIEPISGQIIDPFEGRKDLENKILRAVGNAEERFSEDGLRVLRAARFAATLEVDLDPDTEKAIPRTLDTFKKVSAERVRDEWVKTMKAKRPSRAFEIMKTSGILAITCPELLEGVGMSQNKYHAYDVWTHGMECMNACAGDPILRIAALLHDVGKPKTRAFSEKTKDYTFYDHDQVGAEIAHPIATRLKFSNDERARIVDLVRHHLFHYTDEWNDATVRRWMKRVGVDRISDLYVLNEADVRSKGLEGPPDLDPLEKLKAHVAKVEALGAALSTRDLAIDGRDLMNELGLAPGPILGKILNALLEDVIADPAKNGRDSLLQRAREIAARIQEEEQKKKD